MANRDVTFTTPTGDYLEARALADTNGISLEKPDSNPIGVKFGNSESVDAFSRARVTSPYHLFENKNIYDNNPDEWASILVGGATITYSTNESSNFLNVTTASGDLAVRQSDKYIPYLPGKSQVIMQTFAMAPMQLNLRQRVGYFDTSNGLFIEAVDETDIAVVIRSSTTGSPVDTRYTRASWNLDPLDGTGPSGYTLDISKIQIFIIDFQWLGAGRVRYGFGLNGHVIYFHEVNHANTLDKVYMTTPALPVRYEIENIGVTATASTLKEVCSSVASEGTIEVHGESVDVDTGIPLFSTSTTEKIVLLVRLKKRINTIHNRSQGALNAVNIYNDGTPALYKVKHYYNTSYLMTHGAVTGGPFQAGETITGGTSGATATITVVGAGNVEYVETNEFYFQAGETITGGTSGATATISTVTTWTTTTGDALEYATSTPGLISTNIHQLNSAVVPVASGLLTTTGTNGGFEISPLDKHGSIFQSYDSNNSQVFGITVDAVSGTGTGWCAMKLLETT